MIFFGVFFIMKYMKLALELAKKGEGKVFPNPMVGCVIVKNGRVVGKGWHKIYGGAHAEVNALRAARSAAAGAQMYVTLEPCSNAGKQPPCVDAIIAAKIKKVYIAAADPNSAGIKKLRAAGVEVETGLLERKAKKLNSAFFNHFKTKPKTTVKFAMSLDGKIATASGDSKWISNPKSRALVHKLRTQHDGILAGFNTVIKDNPSLTSHGAGKNPVRIIIDRKLKTPPHYHVLDGRTPTLVFCDKNAPAPAHFKHEGITLFPVGTNFKTIIKTLRKNDIKTLLIEGGGETIASAFEAKCVDEIYCFIAPLIVGGRAAHTPVAGIGASKIKNALRLPHMKIKNIDGDILIYVHGIN